MKEKLGMEYEFEGWEGSSTTKRRKLGKVNFVSTGIYIPNQDNTSTDNKSDLGLGLGLGGLGNESDEFLPTEFGKKIKEGAIRRERERLEKKRAHDHHAFVDVGKFEKHTKGIGMKLLEKMGYKGGGLGKNAQGILAPIEAKLRAKSSGLGFNESKEEATPVLSLQTEKKKKNAQRGGATQALSPTLGRTKERLWAKKKPGLKKEKKEYITAEELLMSKLEEDSEVVVQKIYDMRGSHVRVYTNMSDFNAGEKAAKENEDVPMPELQHNIRLIVLLAEADIQEIDRDLWRDREVALSLIKEKDELEAKAAFQKQQLDKLEEIMSVLDRVEEQKTLGVLTLDSLAHCFRDLHTRYADDYKLCNLSCIACSYALPLFIRVFQGWDPCRYPFHGMELLSQWRTLLQGDGCLDIWDTSSPYTQLVSGTILPKLSSVVDTWEPCRDTIPIHTWVHSWLPLLGHKLQGIYQMIYFKLSTVLCAWHPSDDSAYAMLSPWKTVFDSASWEHLMHRFIVPKLHLVLQEFLASRNLDQFYRVMMWAPSIPIHLMVDMMDNFLAKWLLDLYSLLSSNPNFEIVRKWYLCLKELIPKELLENEGIKYKLNCGLVMMEQAVKGMEVVQPCLREQRQYEAQQKAVAYAQQQAATGFGGAVNADGMACEHELSLKEVIEFHAQKHGLVFKPKPGKMHNGHQIYAFGNVSMIIDSLNEKVYAQKEERWALECLQGLVELHNKPLSKRH